VIIDLQVAADAFLTGIRNELRSQIICYTQKLILPTATILLDHVEITDNTVLGTVSENIQVQVLGEPQNISGTFLLVTQEIVLCFATLTDLEASGPAPTPVTSPLFRQSVKVQFLVNAVLINQQPQIQFTYRPPVDAAGLDALQPGISQQIDARLANFTGTFPINLTTIYQLIGIVPLFNNAGIAVAGGRVSLRLEDGGNAPTAQPWSDFYAGLFPDRLGGKSWAIFIDRVLLFPAVLNVFKKPSGGDFKPSGAPAASWAGNGIGVHVSQSGVLPGDGPLGTDVDATVYADLTFSVQAIDYLRLNLSFSASAEPSGLLGDVLEFFGFSPDAGGALPAAQGWTQTGDSSYQQGVSVNFNDSLLGHLAIETVIPDQNGLHIAGTIHPHLVTPATLQTLPFTLKTFKWAVHGSCGSGWDISCFASISLDNLGTAPLSVCAASVLYDPDGQFPVTVNYPQTESGQLSVSVTIYALLPSYAARPSPYPCLVLIQTNGGARVVSFGIPTGLTPAQSDKLQKDHSIYVISCYKLVNHFWGSGLDPKWIPDPPPDDRWLQLWQVEVRGLSEGEQVGIVDEKGRILASGQPGNSGTAFAQSVREPLGSRIGIVRLRKRPGQTGSQFREASPMRNDRSIQVSRIRLELCATMPSTNKDSIMAVRFNGLRALMVVQGLLASLFDLRSPNRPRFLGNIATGDIPASGVTLDTADGSAERQQYGPSRMSASGVFVGNVFVTIKGAQVLIYKPSETTQLRGREE
jgi:hypothetical protein